MNKRKRLLMILVMLMIALSACTARVSQEPPIPVPSAPVQEEKDSIKEQLEDLTLDEKLAQMLIVGLPGYEAGEKAVELIQQYKIGGFILYGSNVKNPEQLLSLTNSLKEMNKANEVPLFLSLDEEGGRISRMPKELRNLPSSRAVGKAGSQEFAYGIGGILAEMTAAFGFNMNYAPVLDINSNPKNPVIGDRAFGAEVDVVSSMGINEMKGMQDGGVISVVKHFPGHGDTSVDSHIGLPLVNHDMERLRSFELIPFEKAIGSGADVIMVAHVLLPKLDSMNPATLSKAIITDLLRSQLKFDGVVMTDDMTMGAIQKNYPIDEASVMAVGAGSDIILVAHGYDNVVAVLDALRRAVREGRITEERINESVYRILALKHKYNLTDDHVQSADIVKLNEKINTLIKTYMK